MRNRTVLAGSTALISLALQLGLCGAVSAQTTTTAPPPASQAATPQLSNTQDPDAAATVDEVVVTGFRQSLANALNQKRRADVQMDAISADDIASFPEANIAESLQRIPGVSVDRDNGEGRQISVRGLGGDFTRVRINGMEALSTSGATSGGLNNPNTSRSFDFNTFASQLFNNASVRKSASAETDEGSLGATVDLNTAKPFDFKGQRVALGAENAYYENGGYNNQRYAGLYSNRWFDGKIGFLVSGAFQERDTTISNFTRQTGVGDYYYRSAQWAGNEFPFRGRFAAPAGTTFNQTVLTAAGRCPGAPTSAPTMAVGSICTFSPTQTTPLVTSTSYTSSAVTPAIGNPLLVAALTGSDPAAYAALYPTGYATAGRFDDSTVIIPSLSYIVRQDLHTERTGFTASAQYQIAERTRLTIDGLYSKFNQVSDNSTIETIGLSRNNTAAGMMNLAAIAGNPTFAQATALRALYPYRCANATATDVVIAQDCGTVPVVIGGATVANSFQFARNRDPYVYYNDPTSPGYVANGLGSAYGIRGLIETLGYPTTKVLGAHVTNGVADYLALSNMDWRSSANRTSYSTEFDQFSAVLDHDFTDNFAVKLNVGASRSTSSNSVLQVEFNATDRPETFIYDARDGGDMPIWNPGFDVANPANWGIVKGLSVMRNSTVEIENEYSQIEADFRWDANDHWTILWGISRKYYDFVTEAKARNLDSINPTEKEAGVTVASLGSVRSFGQGLDLSDGTPTSYFAPDIDAFIRTFGFNCDCVNEYGDFRIDSRRSSVNSGNFTVSEIDTASYIQGNYDYEVFGRSLTGNIGVRRVKTEVEATGRTPVGRSITDSNYYVDWLPSFNVSYEAFRNFYVRFAGSKAMARPQLTNLSPTMSSPTVPSTVGAITGGALSLGNTRLKPFRSDNFDLSLEWYFRPESLVSLAFFDKRVGSYPQVVLYDAKLTDLLDPDSIAQLRLAYANNAAQLAYIDADNTFAVRQPQDAPGGYLRGIEANIQSDFWFLPGFWSNFGFQLNATKIESELTYILDPGTAAIRNPTTGVVTTPATAPTFGKGPWLNASPEAVNFTLYYEVDGFSARVSTAWRSDYYSTYPVLAGSCTAGYLPPTNTSTPEAAAATAAQCSSPMINDFVTTAGTLNVDAAINWDITKRLSIRFEGLNLTNETNNRSTYSANPQTTVYGSSGPQYTVGLRYRY